MGEQRGKQILEIYHCGRCKFPHDVMKIPARQYRLGVHLQHNNELKELHIYESTRIWNSHRTSATLLIAALSRAGRFIVIPARRMDWADAMWAHGIITVQKYILTCSPPTHRHMVSVQQGRRVQQPQHGQDHKQSPQLKTRVRGRVMSQNKTAVTGPAISQTARF